MKIIDITCHVLLAPEYNDRATDSAQDNLVVEVHTDEGIVGIGETDTNPWVARACIESPGTHTMGLSLRSMLIGADPFDTEAIWEQLYRGSAMTGRRGAGVSAIGALDMALWDIKGKASGQPCWRLLGGPQQQSITPYASLQPSGGDIDTYRASLVDWLLNAKAAGFSAAKMEATFFGPYAHDNLHGNDDDVVRTVEAAREAVGPDFTLMLDVQYAWSDSRAALHTLKRLRPFDLFFVETPLWIDDLDGYRLLHEEAGIAIAAGEWQTTRFEFVDLIERGGIDVVQPDVGRVGGLTEAKRVCDIAAQHGRRVVPHCWKTNIGIAASVHLAAATAHCPYVEYLPAEMCFSPLRRELVKDTLMFADGEIALPEQPGLGIELNREAVERFRANEEGISV